MKNITTILALLFTVQLATAQGLSTRKHLVGSSATIAPGFQKGNPDMNLYIHGFAHFYPEPNVSINGEVYWFVGGQNKTTFMKQNSTLLFGPNFHYAKDGAFDPFVGIMPALSLVAINATPALAGEFPQAGKLSVVPLISVNAGINFHVVKWFNAFINIRYMKGTLVNNAYGAVSLDEVRISMGLGFNVFGKAFLKSQK